MQSNGLSRVFSNLWFLSVKTLKIPVIFNKFKEMNVDHTIVHTVVDDVGAIKSCSS